MFATGMRVGELIGLDLDDFSIEERSLRIRGKGGRYRLGFLTDDFACELLIKYRDVRQRIETIETALFISCVRSRITTQGITNLLGVLSEKAGKRLMVNQSWD